MKLLSLPVLVVSIFLLGCIQQPPTGTATPAATVTAAAPTATPMPSVEVTYSVASGWTGWQKTITIKNDGAVVVDERQPFNGNKTVREYQLSDAELKEFKELVAGAGVFSFKDSYNCEPNCATDMPSSSIRFTINGRDKTISMYQPRDMPDGLKQVLEQINAIEEKAR